HGDAGRGPGAARGRHLMEAPHLPRRHLLVARRARRLDAGRSAGRRPHGAAGPPRPRLLPPRHDRRLARAAQPRRGARAAAQRAPLTRQVLFFLYAALVAYASLYPLDGWQDHGLSPFAYLGSAWPRYVTAFDVVGNLLG